MPRPRASIQTPDMPSLCGAATSHSRLSPTIQVSAGWAPSALERPAIHALVRLAESQLPFDENRVEQICELEPLDLLPLGGAGAVREQREAQPRVAQPSHGIDGVRQRRHADIPALAVRIADARGKRVVLDTEIDQG